MSENTPEHQDPAEPYEVGTETETETQADPDGVGTATVEDSDEDGDPDEPELTHGGEMTAVTGSIEVSPSDPVIRGGKQYDVTPEGGHRLRR